MPSKTDASDVGDPWPQIDAWLQEHAPEILRQLRPPLDTAKLAQAERTIGQPLPASLAAAYLAHDGAAGEHAALFQAMRMPKDATWVRAMWWVPMDQALKIWHMHRDLGLDCPTGCLPIGEDGGGNLLWADLDGGALAAWDHETGESTQIAADFATWAAQLATDMAARLVALSEEGDGEALELLSAPRVAPPDRDQVLARDRPAWVLIGALVEREFVALAEGKEMVPLAAALTAALESPNVARRRAQVIKLLEQSSVIDEIFADDEALEQLIDEFI